MKRYYIVPLLLISLLLAGCLFSKKGPESLELSVELRGELAEHQEIIIVGAGGRTLLVDLGAQKVGSLSLKPGSWHLSALSRNGEGMVISHTKSEAAVKGRGKRVVALELVPTSQENNRGPTRKSFSYLAS